MSFDNLKQDFKKLFEFEEVYFRDSTEDNAITDTLKNTHDDDLVCIICCEYYADPKECVLHYDNKYFGSSKFNNIINKYGLHWEWYNNCLAYVWKDHDSDDHDSDDN